VEERHADRADGQGGEEASGHGKLPPIQSYYIAPEIIAGSYCHHCDIWSAGVILYILLTAVPPFDGDSDKEIIEQVRKLKFDINSTPWPIAVPEMKTVSKSAKELIVKILQPENKRISIADIFHDSWILKESPKNPLKPNFSRMSSFSKFSKVPPSKFRSKN
jgi:calcium-dependent protein kinase